MYDWSVLVKKTLLYEFCIGTLQGSGTERHAKVCATTDRSREARQDFSSRFPDLGRLPASQDPGLLLPDRDEPRF